MAKKIAMATLLIIINILLMIITLGIIFLVCPLCLFPLASGAIWCWPTFFYWQHQIKKGNYPPETLETALAVACGIGALAHIAALACFFY